MKRDYNFIAAMLLFMLSFSLFAQEDADISTSKTKKNEKIQLDSRVDNMGYWRKMAELGLTSPNPVIPYKPSEFKGSDVIINGIKVADSPDVPVTSATNVTESENSIFVDPNDNQYVLNSNNSTSWSGSSVGSLYGANYFQTSNGGTSWGGSASGAGGSNNGDPAAAINLNGRQYVGYITSSGGMGASYSDNGSSWTAVTVTALGSQDKNHLWVDNGASSPYQGNVYNSWVDLNSSSGNYADNVISRSTNNGVSWSSVINISSAVNAGSHNQGVNIQTGPNGEVYAVWAIYDSWPSDESAIGMAKSTNGGVSYSAATRIITNTRGIRNTGVPQNMRVNSFPVCAVDISTGANSGNVYVIWTNIGTPGVNSGTAGVYMIRSTNGGSSWSSPIKVNQGSGTAYQPWITCDPETGVLAVVYYDNRNTATADAEAWVSYSTDAGSTWTDFRVSDVSFTPTPIPGLASGYMGDYLGITSKGGRFYPCWTDNRGSTYMTYVSPFELGLNADFTADATNICTGSSVNFTDLSTGPPATYSWTFTGGTPATATGAGPHNITYSTSGTYNVSLTVTDGGSGTDTEIKTGYITVENVIADFTGAPTTVIVGNTVTFTDNSACGPTSWSWTFPGGTPGTATGSGPHAITYNTVGTYNVTLAVTSGGNNDTETKTNYIDVINCNYCTTSYSNTSDDYVSNVNFNTINNASGSTTYSDFTSISTNVTTGNTYSVSANITVNGSWTQHCWVWIDWNRDCDFDDAGEAFDLGQTPGTTGTHTLSTNITVPSGAILGSTRMRVSELYAADPGPCTVSTYGEAEDYTVVIQSSAVPPVANFSADDTTPAISQTVSFTDLSSNGPTSWSWSISPGTFNYTGGSNSSSQNPQVQFNAGGYYTITLVTTNASGSDGETKTNYILAGTAGNWTGASSTAWSLASNWENLAIPSSTDNVTIPTSATNYPVYTGNFALGTDCNDMTLEGNASFISSGDMNISTGRSLSCNGSNDITVGGNWINDGTFNPGTGTVTFDGNATSTIDAAGVIINSLLTTFAGGNGSNGNMFDIVALNEVTVTSFDGNLNPGTGLVHIYYKSGTYVGFETNAAAWTLVGTVSTTSAGNGSGTPIPIAVNVTIPAGQTYAFYVHAENGNAYTNGSTAGNIYVSDANIQILEGNGRGNPVFTGGTYSPRVFNGIVHYSYAGGSGGVSYHNLFINKANAEVSNIVDLTLTGDLTIGAQGRMTNPVGNTIAITGNLLIEGNSTSKGSFIDNGTTTVGGTSTVQKNYTDNRWHYITSPVTNAISNNFFGMYLYYWLEDTYSWFNVVSTDSLLRVGKGYGLWSTISNPTIDFSGGSLNTGNISIPVSATDSDGGGIGPTEGWNLIGNPYPSAIDLGAPGNVLPGYTWTNLISTVYMNDGTQYATYNPNTGTSTNGATQYVPSMQGFFVKADNLNPVLMIPNSARLHSAQSNYKSAEDFQMLKLVTQGNGYSDEIILMASEEATSGFDSKYDAYKMMGKEEAPQLYCIIPNIEVSVNTLSQITEETVVGLGVKTGVAGSYSIGISELEQFEAFPFIILEDLQTNTFVNLLTTETYQFSSTPEDISHRFNLHFKDVGVGMIENSAGAILVYSHKDVIYIETEVAFSGDVKVFDMMGQQIYHKAAEASTGISIPVSNGTGYYLVQVQTNNKLVAKKVFIK